MLYQEEKDFARVKGYFVFFCPVCHTQKQMVTFAKAWKQQTSGQMTIGKACRIGALVLFVLLLLTWANYLFQLTGVEDVCDF